MRFGLIGAGCIGRLRAKALRRISRANLIAVTDSDETVASRIAAPTRARVCQSVGEILSLAEVDAVIIATPPQFHEEAVLAALHAGKHVLCEKPLSNSVPACRRLVEAAQESGRKLATGFNHRYFPAIQFLKKAIADGAIGQLDHVRAFAGHEGLSQFRAPWEYDKNVIGGGALMDVGIHIIDLTAYVLGDVREVFGIATEKVWQLNGAEDNGFALLRNGSGQVATLHASWSEWKGYRFSIEAYGDKGMVRAFYAPMFNLLVTKKNSRAKPRRRFALYPQIALKEKLFGWQSTAVETFRQELNDFIASCNQGTPGQNADGLAALHAVEIANAVYRSSADRCVILLPGRSEILARTAPSAG
jgi:predicted dehydrogenase